MAEEKPFVAPAASIQEYDDQNKLIAVAPEQRAETVAFALQNIIYNIGGNLFEPYINLKVQTFYSHADPLHKIQAGSYAQNLAGEFAGDLVGSGGLMLAEAVAPVQLHSCTRKMRSMIDPVYTAIADTVFANRKDDPNYEHEKNEWKLAQERSLVRSTIVTAGAVAGNIVMQKAVMHNPAPAKLIMLGKLASSSLTNAIGLVVRAAFPTHTKGLDKWMSKNIHTLFDEKDEPSKTR